MRITSAALLTGITLAMPVMPNMSATVLAQPHEQVLLRAIVLDMGPDAASVTDASYNSLFRGGNATKGVSVLIAAGRFRINGFPLPSNASAFGQTSPSGYLVNQVPWLTYDAEKKTWRGGYKAEKVATSYAAAALETATGIVAGLEVRLYDENGDGFADLIDADYKEGVLVGQILRQADGGYRVLRADVDATGIAGAGRVYDGGYFTPTSEQMIKESNFDPAVAPGDVALFSDRPEGWVIERAKEVKGAFRGGTDHKDYKIGGTLYQDAMRFSRDNIPISNRPGEYANVREYFQKTSDDAIVSLWLVPTTDPTRQGAPVALTSGGRASAFLTEAIAAANAKLQDTRVSADGSDVPTDEMWVEQAAYSQLSDAVHRAQQMLAEAGRVPAALDFQSYLLYLTLQGSTKDIGAKFGGFEFAGFVPKRGRRQD